MAQLGEQFSQDSLPESPGFEPIPNGWYTTNIAGADLKDTNAGTGQYIAMQLLVTGPNCQGRVVWANLNIRNPSQKAEKIGRGQLNAVMRAIGLLEIDDTDQLIGGSLDVKVSIRRSEEYGDRNEVKDYRAIEGSAAPGPSAPKKEKEPAKKSPPRPPWAK